MIETLCDVCICQPGALTRLFAVLEGDGDVFLVYVGGEEVVSVYLTVEGESHGLAIRVLVP